MKSFGEGVVGGVPPRRVGNRRRTGWWVGLGVLAGLGGLALLGWQEPAGQIYYPRCALFVMTGLKCPGCGVMRSTHFLLRGEWGAAWRMNALWVSLMPLWVWTGVALLVRGWGWRIWNPMSVPWVWGSVAGLACVYGLMRNVPGLGGAGW